MRIWIGCRLKYAFKIVALWFPTVIKDFKIKTSGYIYMYNGTIEYPELMCCVSAKGNTQHSGRKDM